MSKSAELMWKWKETEDIELRMSRKMASAEINGERGTGEVGLASWLVKHRGWLEVNEKWYREHGEAKQDLPQYESKHKNTKTNLTMKYKNRLVRINWGRKLNEKKHKLMKHEYKKYRKQKIINKMGLKLDLKHKKQSQDDQNAQSMKLPHQILARCL